MSLFVFLALTADAQPCYGWDQPDIVDGPRVSVEYTEGEVVNEAGAQIILDAAEGAWDAYTGLGFREPIGAPSISIEVDPLGRGGFASTELCGDDNHAKLFVYEGGLAFDAGRATAVHELFHAVQYGYDTSLSVTTHYATWPWFSEGSATWAETAYSGDPSGTFRNFRNYLERGHFPLHQDLSALGDADRTAFLYGTSLFVHTLDELEGPDAIASTLQAGAARAGELAWFPDVLADAGIDFDTLWADHLRRLPTVDFEFGADFGTQAPRASAIRTLPGSASADPDTPPESLGWAIHRIRPEVLPGTELEITFTGDADPRWHVVLVTANRNRAGAPATALLSEIVEGDEPLTTTVAYADPLFVVVSPEIRDDGGFDYAIDVAAGEVEDPPGGCGCTSSGNVGSSAGVAFLVAFLVSRSRRPRLT